MYKRSLRLLSFLLTLVMLLHMLPATAWAEELMANSSVSASSQAANKEAVIVEEIESGRTEYSKEFKLSNGLHMAAVYNDPVHYEENGQWKDIDNTLKLSSGTYTNTAGVWDVSFPQQLSKNNAVTITKDGYTLSFFMSGQLRSPGNLEVMSSGVTKEVLTANTELALMETVPVSMETLPLTVGAETFSIGAETFAVQASQTSTAQVQKIDLTEEKASAKHPETVSDTLHSRLQYENIYSNTDVVYDLVSNQVKESIIIGAYDAALRGYRYTLNTGSMIPVLTDSGEIHLYDEKQENIVMVMPAPYLLDDAMEYCGDVTVNLSGAKGTYILTYTLPQSWLADEARQYPVVLDPVVEVDVRTQSDTRDVTVYERNTEYDNNYYILDVGHNEKYGTMRLFLKYKKLPVLTASDVITSAELAMVKPNNSDICYPIEVHKVLGDWESESITWEHQPAFDTTIEDYAMVQNIGTYFWDITDIVRGWYAGGNTGLMLKAPDNIENTTSTESYRRQFYSSDWNANVCPAVSILFRSNNGLESYWDYTSSSAGRAGSGSINNYTGNLVWTRSDIGFGGKRMPVTISQVYNANDSQNNTFGMGYGWRTNFNQRVYQWSENSNYYVWEDDDGTSHYFLKKSTGVYKDEDGLELTLKTTGSGTKKYSITNKSGNVSYFDTKGRLTKQENNQATKSSITVTYTTTDGYLIDTVTDGVGRVYDFDYPNGLLSRISYKGNGSEELSYVAYGYTDSKLTSVTDEDGETSRYTYGANNLLLTAQDIDGYKLTYTYNQTETGKPSRIASVEESDGSVLGGKLTFQYDHNQTTITDINGTANDTSDDRIQILQFNNWGNTVSVQDGEGRAQFGQYANNDSTDTASSAKGNQLTLSSKLQNTVGNIHRYTSFESLVLNSSSSGVSCEVTNTQAYYGDKSMRVSSTYAGGNVATCGYISIPAGSTYTFSGYVKVTSGKACLGIFNGTGTVLSETTNASEWTRQQVTYKNTTNATQSIVPVLFMYEPGTAYIDCAQVEEAPTASRYNLVTDGDFHYSAYDWTTSDGYTLTADTAAAPELEGTVYTITGDPESTKRASQTVKISGSEGDTFVLAGWAKGNAVPFNKDTENPREFGIIATFHYTEATEEEDIATFTAQFNTDVENWQYSSEPMVAAAAYDYITIELAYDYNANTVSFDGIQLFKEVFGTSYTYDDNGNVISVVDLQKQKTTYEYDVDENLIKVTLPNRAVLSYTYDDYRNVKTATTDEGLLYEFEYDSWGNNTSVSIVNSDGVKITSTAEYSTDGNTPVSSTDALGNVTRYGYNADTGILEWVQYPKDSEATRTEYTYDEMCRRTAEELTTDTGLALSAKYTFENDLLTKLETPSTTYGFTYGDFALRSSVKVGNTTLASYSYTNDRNFYLETLDYANGDSVQYEYDQQGRIIKETYEDASYVTYDYDNSGALATVYDSETGFSTTYYYDLIDRMMKYVESGSGYSHSVGYEYDTINNLTQIVETINGVKRTTSYGYDDDNRVTSITNDLTPDVANDGITESYTYDAFGRITTKVTKNGDTTVLTETYTYKPGPNGTLTSQIATHKTEGANYSVTYTYDYDVNGNITSVSDGTYTTTYAYDSANQLIRENNQQAGKTYTWTYDNAGNIQSKKTYAYTTSTVGTASDTVNYSYDESQWRDLLTAYDGNAITYDQIGNPLSDGTWSYTWEQGRQLATLSDGASTWTNTYNADGLRTSRSNGTSSYSYVYNGSQLVQMTVDGNTLLFTYDASGTPQAVTYNGTTYFYTTNLQGDVTAILDSTGATVVSYTYDAWGNHTSGNNGTGTDASTLGRYNPLRYRGYVYDVESQLYYLQSRYYNPEIGRFINADCLASTGQGILGNNMFAYCGNNPIIRIDSCGTEYRTVGAGIQFEIDSGNGSVGVEVIVYWDVDECNGGRNLTVAVYVYGGVSFDVSDPLMGSILAMITDNTDILIEGSEAEIIAFATLLSSTFSISVSGVLVRGNEDFTTTESYEGSFTSMNASIGRLCGSIAYATNCRAYSLGGKIVNSTLSSFAGWGISKTLYGQFWEFNLPNPFYKEQ